MSLKIDGDVGRFKEIIKGKVRKDLKKHMSSGHMVGQQGKKVIKVPMPGINIPHFTFGGKNVGGTGMGDGEIGDSVGKGKGKKGQGGKEAGEGTGDHLVAEFTPEELAQILGEELQLPRIENKGKEEVKHVKDRYTDISQNGVILHRKKTYLNALKRNIAQGTFDHNAESPYVIPIKEDRRYKTYETKPEPEEAVLICYCRDYSGSMTDEMTARIQSCAFWVSLWLQHEYGKIEERFFVHDTEGVELTREEFFAQSPGGGTRISSLYEVLDPIIQENQDRNIYILEFSDNENFGSDNSKCIELLNEKILPFINLFCYGSVSDEAGGYYDVLKESIQSDKCILASMPTNDTIMDTIKSFLGTGK